MHKHDLIPHAAAHKWDRSLEDGDLLLTLSAEHSHSRALARHSVHPGQYGCRGSDLRQIFSIPQLVLYAAPANNAGAYQWRLFALCGCGWMSDASALACIAVILPRVSVHFGLGSETAGVLSASMMAGVSRAGRAK